MAHNDNIQGLAQVYAAALFDVATELGNVDAVENEILALQEVLSGDKRLRLFFDTPTVPFPAKRRVLVAALAGFTKPVRNFMCLLVQRQRVELFDRIVQEFHDHCNRAAGIAEFDLTSARALLPDEMEQLKAALVARMKRKVEVREEVRPELLGGLILQHRDTQWDASLLRRLRAVVSRMQAVKGGAGLWRET
ncbi:MAG: ATP synthase F1 subunit delta [Planctomycetota bacterium]|nr:ATP synthase F1 subunit delta [Planctomycetota bacterium]